ncbi:MAG: DUF4190 domain-containing protein [Defluviitaleaceae bacterium]|nr:DUF4190 domain-containing protein [Defluviitaleaceae bacterium]
MFCSNCGNDLSGVTGDFCTTCGTKKENQPSPQHLQQNTTYPTPYYHAAPSHEGKATASLVLGIIGLVAWFLPIVGLPVTITGLVLGIKGRNSYNRKLATVGVVLSSIGLTASVINAALGAYMGVMNTF